ncbi:unnamed protein product [Cuscuta epithymum]|uniref:Homeobox-leucine zipper protein n=1 Tax=Cuscuta epithymum TaxID=186058 RepID=A0AAV0CYN5_9ASTE|nr:unnamed protein product [Cuscuta epithymum]
MMMDMISGGNGGGMMTFASPLPPPPPEASSITTFQNPDEPQYFSVPSHHLDYSNSISQMLMRRRRSAASSSFVTGGDRGWDTGEDNVMLRRPRGGEDEMSDDGSSAQLGEKKRRLGLEQVKALEKSFEQGNKLEPERKMELARALGLQPRQIAIWFQNRRARSKTKQLEKDYDLLKRQLEALSSDNNALKSRNKKLHSELQLLALRNRESKGAGPATINLNQETEGCSWNTANNASETNSGSIIFTVDDHRHVNFGGGGGGASSSKPSSANHIVWRQPLPPPSAVPTNLTHQLLHSSSRPDDDLLLHRSNNNMKINNNNNNNNGNDGKLETNVHDEEQAGGAYCSMFGEVGMEDEHDEFLDMAPAAATAFPFNFSFFS